MCSRSLNYSCRTEPEKINLNMIIKYPIDQTLVCARVYGASILVRRAGIFSYTVGIAHTRARTTHQRRTGTEGEAPRNELQGKKTMMESPSRALDREWARAME